MWSSATCFGSVMPRGRGGSRRRWRGLSPDMLEDELLFEAGRAGAPAWLTQTGDFPHEPHRSRDEAAHASRSSEHGDSYDVIARLELPAVRKSFHREVGSPAWGPPQLVISERHQF